jgi:small-conductance mechanosensitive channel
MTKKPRSGDRKNMEHISQFIVGHFKPDFVELLFDRCIKIAVLFVGVLICSRAIHIVSRRVLKMSRYMADRGSNERDKRLDTVIKLTDTTTSVVLFTLAFMMALKEFGFDITPLLTGAGIAGVALGFGFQSLVTDLVAGFFLLLEDQIRLGDVIKVNDGLGGTVEHMAFRVTSIRDTDGTLHTIPNGEIKSVSNMTVQFGQALIDIPLPYQTDLKKVNDVLTTSAQEFRKDPKWKDLLLGDPQWVGVTDFKDDHLVVEVTLKTHPLSRWDVQNELRLRFKSALDAAGIALPTSSYCPVPTVSA